MTVRAGEDFPWVGLLSLSFAYFMVGTSSLCVIGLVPVISADLGIAAPDIAILVTVFALTFAIVAPTGQVVLKRFSRAQILLLGLAFLAIGMALAAAAPDYRVLFVSRIVLGIGGALVSPMCSAIGSEMTTPESQGRAMGLVFSGLAISTVVGVPLTAYLGTVIGWRMVMALIGLMALLSFALVLANIRDSQSGSAAKFEHLFSLMRQRESGLAILSALLQMAAMFCTYALIAPYLISRYGMSTELISLYLMLYGVCGILGNFFVGRISDRFGPVKTILLSLVGSIVGILFVWGLGTTALLALIGMCIWSAFGMMFHAPQQHRLANMSTEHRGLMMALNASALYLGMSIGAWISRQVYIGMGYEFLPLASVAGLLICIAALLISAWRKPG